MSTKNKEEILFSFAPVFKDENGNTVTLLKNESPKEIETLEFSLDVNELLEKHLKSHCSLMPISCTWIYLKRVFDMYVESEYSTLYNKETKLKMLFMGEVAKKLFFSYLGNDLKGEIVGTDYNESFEVEENTIYIAVIHLESLLKTNPNAYGEMCEKLRMLLMDKIIF